MAADDLAMQGARATAAMIFTKWATAAMIFTKLNQINLVPSR